MDGINVSKKENYGTPHLLHQAKERQKEGAIYEPRSSPHEIWALPLLDVGLASFRLCTTCLLLISYTVYGNS